MASLKDIFREYETDQLEMIVEQWGLSDDINWHIPPELQVAELLDDQPLFEEILAALPASAIRAFEHIADEEGKIERSIFARKYGKLREMGAAMREKERPDRNPITDTENLFYRGLIALAFFETDGEAKEYFFIPDEFLTFVKSKSSDTSKIKLPVLDKKSLRHIQKEIKPGILQLIALHAAILRGGIMPQEYQRIISQKIEPFITGLLIEKQVITDDKSIITDALPEILLKGPQELIPSLFELWMQSDKINDLHMVPGLIFEGQWINPIIKPREIILDLVGQLPADRWFQLSDFINWVYENEPHFLRLGGEYEQWFIKDRKSDAYLKGFKSWSMVDGKLIEFIITGPLCWFGLIETGWTKGSARKIAFMKTDLADDLISGNPKSAKENKNDRAIIHKDGRIFLPRNGNREALYQIARFFEWHKINATFFTFRITPLAIKRAEKQHISVAQLIALLKKFGKPPIPRNIISALNRWGKSGPEIRVENGIIIRFKHPSILTKIAPKLSSEIQFEEINPSMIMINKNDMQRFDRTIRQAGYLLDDLSKYNY